nr:hypothetical protein [Treponema sp.]
MDLTALHDLKERIENAVISGTSLLHEDFKLRKAYENFLPLSELSPVFGKIKDGMEGVYSADKDTMNGRLLDTLALIDAVVYTQSEADEAAGEMKAIERKNAIPTKYIEIPHSAIQKKLPKFKRTMYPEDFAECAIYIADYRFLPKFAEGLERALGMESGRIMSEGVPCVEKSLSENRTFLNKYPLLESIGLLSLMQLYAFVDEFDGENTSLLSSIEKKLKKSRYFEEEAKTLVEEMRKKRERRKNSK